VTHGPLGAEERLMKPLLSQLDETSKTAGSDRSAERLLTMHDGVFLIANDASSLVSREFSES
jgi:hypothetical protein